MGPAEGEGVGGVEGGEDDRDAVGGNEEEGGRRGRMSEGEGGRERGGRTLDICERRTNRGRVSLIEGGCKREEGRTHKAA